MTAAKAMILAGFRFAGNRVSVGDFSFCHWVMKVILPSDKMFASERVLKRALFPRHQLCHPFFLNRLMVMQYTQRRECT